MFQDGFQVVEIGFDNWSIEVHKGSKAENVVDLAFGDAREINSRVVHKHNVRVAAVISPQFRSVIPDSNPQRKAVGSPAGIVSTDPLRVDIYRRRSDIA